jgi:hypothetical protein
MCALPSPKRATLCTHHIAEVPDAGRRSSDAPTLRGCHCEPVRAPHTGAKKHHLHTGRNVCHFNTFINITWPLKRTMPRGGGNSSSSDRRRVLSDRDCRLPKTCPEAVGASAGATAWRPSV